MNARFSTAIVLALLAAPALVGVEAQIARTELRGLVADCPTERLADQRRGLVQPPLLASARNQPRHGRASEGCLAGTTERLGIRPAIFGRSTTDLFRRRALRCDARQRCFRHRRRQRRLPVDLRGEPRSRHLDGLLRLDQSRCGDRRRQSLRRPARRQARRSRSGHGQRRLEHLRPSDGRTASRSRPRRSTTTAS